MRRRRGSLACAIGATALLGALSACSVADPDDGLAATPSATVPRTIIAERLTEAAPARDGDAEVLLEGPTFHEDGGLLVVDVTAAPGTPKVLRIDVETGAVEPFADGRSDAVYTSAQFSPVDGRLYLTDFLGAIDSMTVDGGDLRTEFSGAVDGAVMAADDLTFDDDGNLFVTDAAGLDAPHGDPVGRVVRIDATTREASVIADGLASPNGISFDSDGADLWVSVYNANRIDRLLLTDDRTALNGSFIGMHVDGGITRVDSTAVDADGNVYQGFHDRPGLRVFAEDGRVLADIEVPQEEAGGLSSATNIAIRPGTREAFATVSGEDGGFIYTFEALGEGIRQSNGG